MAPHTPGHLVFNDGVVQALFPIDIFKYAGLDSLIVNVREGHSLEIYFGLLIIQRVGCF